MRALIVGGGRVGGRLAALLLDTGHEVGVIERRSQQAADLVARLPAAVVTQGSGTDPTVLERAGIHRCDVAAAVTGNDETNLVVAGIARFEFSVGRTIARVVDPRNAWMFTDEMGVDVALDQADVLAHLIAEELSLGAMITLLQLRRGRLSLVEERVGPTARAAGRKIRDLGLPQDCVLVAVLRSGGVVVPRGEVVIEAGDEVLALVQTGSAGDVADLLGGADRGPSTRPSR
jgi:trk system potassium uptake protein TrkA